MKDKAEQYVNKLWGNNHLVNIEEMAELFSDFATQQVESFKAEMIATNDLNGYEKDLCNIVSPEQAQQIALNIIAHKHQVNVKIVGMIEEEMQKIKPQEQAQGMSANVEDSFSILHDFIADHTKGSEMKYYNMVGELENIRHYASQLNQQDKYRELVERTEKKLTQLKIEADDCDNCNDWIGKYGRRLSIEVLTSILKSEG